MSSNQRIGKSIFSKSQYLNLELLRFTTAGSVDDGKSTLIGRLLYDSKSIFQDQMAELKQITKNKGNKHIDLAFLTDGLRAEREQGITIDVAYRYFSTPKRKFIIADTPGHEQYTRNMVTGASTANLAIILIDARKGVLTQSRRHGFIASLLGIQHLLVAINKMDLVNWSQEKYQQILNEYTVFSEKLSIKDISFIPVSALKGDNVVKKSKKMKWYHGNSILQHLETITIAADRNLQDFRFPVQHVIRHGQDFRGFAGRVESGTIHVGDEIICLPSGHSSRVKELLKYKDSIQDAFHGESIVISLEEEIDISRGDMIVRKENLPIISNSFEAIICWMDEKSILSTKQKYILKHTTRKVSAIIKKLNFCININMLNREVADHLSLNEIGRVEIETAYPLFFDPYNDNRATGSFILVNPANNQTVAAGMIRHESRSIESTKIFESQSEKTHNYSGYVTLNSRIERNGHSPAVIWLTGLSGSGKTTISRELERRLFNEGKQVYVLDGDDIRSGLNAGLGFTEEDRKENIRRSAQAAHILYSAGFIVICSFISPLEGMRDMARALFPSTAFSEVYVHADIEVVKKRDPKGLYQQVARGEISNFTGIHQQYEPSNNPELKIDTQTLSVEESVERILKLLR